MKKLLLKLLNKLCCNYICWRCNYIKDIEPECCYCEIREKIFKVEELEYLGYRFSKDHKEELIKSERERQQLIDEEIAYKRTLGRDL